ncbi:MAG: hypothetical protein IJL55_02985 [Lachnospiraceae bacterium]|nr:hypothetical protein [Lachnospiraceae bacterium]
MMVAKVTGDVDGCIARGNHGRRNGCSGIKSVYAIRRDVPGSEHIST